MIYKRKVNYYETDSMKIVHHSNYLRWFEEARINALSELGLEYSALESMGILIPVLKASCEYKTPAVFGEEVYINTQISHFDGIRLNFSYKVTDGNGTLKALGETDHCFLDKDFKPVNIKKNKPEIYQKLLSAVEQ